MGPVAGHVCKHPHVKVVEETRVDFEIGDFKNFPVFFERMLCFADNVFLMILRNLINKNCKYLSAENLDLELNCFRSIVVRLNVFVFLAPLVVIID